MKFLFLSMYISTSLFAIVTKDCPKSISYSLEMIDSLNTVQSNGWNDIGIQKAQDQLNEEKDLKGSLTFKNKYVSKCFYEGLDSQGRFIHAKLEGSTRTNAIKPATLLLYAAESMAIYFPIAKVQKNGLTLKNPKSKISIYFRGQYCSWGDCIPDHINIASASILNI